MVLDDDSRQPVQRHSGRIQKTDFSLARHVSQARLQRTREENQG